MNGLKVLIMSSEVAPFSKVGGLADVVGALPSALSGLGVECKVLSPLYTSVKEKKDISLEKIEAQDEIRVHVAGREYKGDLFSAQNFGSNAQFLFLANDHFFSRNGIYADQSTGEEFSDNAERFIFFSASVFKVIKALKWLPHVIHCNDYHTSLVPAYIKLKESKSFGSIATLLTIHNLGYQGIFQPDVVEKAGFSMDQFKPMSPFEFYGNFNFLKLGIVYADIINTVSETYAREITENPRYGHNLEGVLRERLDNLFGVINGVDYSVWDPSLDPYIPFRYSSRDLSGKLKNKKVLLERHKPMVTNLKWPLIGMISRLAHQKGFDILIDIFPELMRENLLFILLGTGDPNYHKIFQKFARKYPQKVGINLTFDPELAHLIEAGSDIFLMPSRYEPCGLNQMYSLRYGTVPVVRKTGGLADTVDDYNPQTGKGTGFVFENYSPSELLKAIKRALDTYRKREKWLRIMIQGMQADFSWDRSAEKYLEIYRKAIKKVS